MTAEDDILFRVQEGVAHVTLNRPEARNAFTFAMYQRLAEICEAVNADRAIKALLLTSSGEWSFCAGADINEFRAMKTPEDVHAYEALTERAIGGLESCRVPTIAAIAGACIGDGAMLAAVCDLQVVTADAQFGLPIGTTLGNCLTMANYARLTALIGPRMVKELIFTARMIPAAEAKRIGLVSEIVNDVWALMPRADYVTRLATMQAPLTLRATKEALRRLQPILPHADNQDLFLMCLLSEDFQNGVEAFLAKRKPVWRGQ